jgi:hypothetical protein
MIKLRVRDNPTNLPEEYDMEQNLDSVTTFFPKYKSRIFVLIGFLLLIMLIAYFYTRGPRPLGQSGYPPMYRIEHASDPDRLQQMKSITYKKGIQSSLLDSSLKIVWGNGRFRMMDTRLAVEDYDKLQKNLNDFRYFGCEFGLKNKPEKPTMILVENVTEEVRRIRYVNGILYCMGKDAYVCVDIKNETWKVFVDPTKAPSPHKEEFAKLQGHDKENQIWVPYHKEDAGNWEWEDKVAHAKK